MKIRLTSSTIFWRRRVCCKVFWLMPWLSSLALEREGGGDEASLRPVDWEAFWLGFGCSIMLRRRCVDGLGTAR